MTAFANSAFELLAFSADPLVRLSGKLGQVGVLFGQLQFAGGVTVIDILGPLTVLRGDDVTYRVVVTDDTDARVNLTDATVLEVQLKPALGAADPATISKALGAGVDLLDQGDPDTKGVAEWTFTSSDTDKEPGLYWLDVVLVLNGKRTHVVAPREYTIADVVNAP